MVLELAQMYSYHLGDTDRDLRTVNSLQHSLFPVHSSLAYTLSGQWTTDRTDSDLLLEHAIEIAQPCGLDRIARFAADLLEIRTPNGMTRSCSSPRRFAATPTACGCYPHGDTGGGDALGTHVATNSIRIKPPRVIDFTS